MPAQSTDAIGQTDYSSPLPRVRDQSGGGVHRCDRLRHRSRRAYRQPGFNRRAASALYGEDALEWCDRAGRRGRIVIDSRRWIGW